MVHDEPVELQRPPAARQRAGNLGLAAASNAMFNTPRWLANGAYLRLKNVQLGYSFPKAMMP